MDAVESMAPEMVWYGTLCWVFLQLYSIMEFMQLRKYASVASAYVWHVLLTVNLTCCNIVDVMRKRMFWSRQ